ncbi:MAG: nucleotidyltransferase domain-containing protein [Anaerolineales bacterium]
MGAPPALVRDLKRFRARLVDQLGDVDALLLFGSQASGRAGPDSDVDLLVVSRVFAGHSYIGRIALVDPAWDLPYPVDFLCYTPEEFERLRGQISIVKAALDEGVEVGA